MMSMEGNGTMSNNLTEHNLLQTVTQNASLSDECQKVVFSEMDFLPWDNPDNVVSAEVERATHRIKDILLIFLFLIGGPGNVINMAVFYKQGFKDRVNLCLFALSLADELYLIVAMFLHAEQAYLLFTTNEIYGNSFTFLANNHLIGFLGFRYVSQIMSAIIASERCYCVLRPLKIQSLMRNRTMITMIIIVYVLVVGLFFIAALRLHIGCIYNPQSGLTEKAPIIGHIYSNHKELIDYVDGFFFGAGLPGCVMAVTVTTTITTIMKLRQIVTWRAGTSSSLSSREVALTKMLVGNSVLFIACAFPFCVAKISWLFFPEMNAGRRNHNFYLTSNWIGELSAYINSSFNIFVYYGMGSRFRETLSSLLMKKNKHPQKCSNDRTP